ncbi:MAG: hypothetical protein GF346_10375, partial [Candidatus Eisenbacteria bacterium]|nr:hypothetical protein [Candidatus Latescibacterota bacterium]MBD3302841.1 hypothetical protein [Candidatus Eisenbacteria bacterium]
MRSDIGSASKQRSWLIDPISLPEREIRDPEAKPILLSPLQIATCRYSSKPITILAHRSTGPIVDPAIAPQRTSTEECMSLCYSRLRLGIAFLAVLCVVSASRPASAERAPSRLAVAEGDPGRMILDLDLGDLDLLPADVDGRAAVRPVLPGAATTMEKGAPQLPVLRRALLIDDAAEYEVHVLEMDVDLVPADLVPPSKGHLSRDRDPRRIPYEFGTAYARDRFYPEESVVLHEPFVLRDFRGLVLEVRPIRYNPVDGMLAIARRMTVEVRRIGGPGANRIERAAPPRGIDTEFLPVYERTFANWDTEGMRYEILPEPGRCLILTADEFHDAVLPLYEWELQKGIPTILARLSEVGGSAAQVKQYIQSLYDEPEGLTYVILVGDAAQMPYLRGAAENAPSDPMYVKLAGGDHYPDALISRISAQNVQQVETQVARFIRYERDPDEGTEAAWYRMATGVASGDYGGGAYDWQRADLLRDVLLGATYAEVDQIYAPDATKAMVTAAINEGRGLLNYIGHGGVTSWVTTGFGVQDVHALANGFRNPYICDVACLNGDFTYSECFAEAWLRSGTAEAPRGAIGIYASSTNASWVPPCDLQTEVVRLLTEEVVLSLGGLSFNGLMKAMDLWPGYEATKLMEQYHLFGDCTLLLRTREPQPVALAHEGEIAFGQSTYTVDAGVAGARVALYDAGVLYGSALAGPDGVAVIGIDPLPPAGADLVFTLTGPNLETIVETVPVLPAADAEVALAEHDAGGAPLDAGRPREVALRLRNDGTDPARAVTARLRPLDAGVALPDSTAAFGDIAPADSVWGSDSFVVIPDPDLPDGAELALLVLIDAADGLSWADTLSLPVRAPRIVYVETVVDDAAGDSDRRVDAGERAGLTMRIENAGSGDAIGLSALLSSVDPRIEVTQPVSGADTLRAGEARLLTAPFEVEVEAGVSEGTAAFLLTVETETGTVASIGTDLPIGGYFESVEHGSPGVTHAPADGFADQWHISEEANATPGGLRSWKCGAATPDSGYAGLLDARLEPPSLTVGPGARLTFYHRIEAETDPGQESLAFDGGVVEISRDGGPYEILVPEDGYTHTIADRGAGGPFAGGTPCFSGAISGERAAFDLGSGGAIRIRFRFGSDSTGTG